MDTPAGQARFDHGAQFFTTRSDLFSSTVASAVEGGAWSSGRRVFGNGWVSTVAGKGMTSLCKWLLPTPASFPNSAPGFSTLVTNWQRGRRCRDPAPVPQALATMAFGGLLPGIELAQQPTGIHPQADDRRHGRPGGRPGLADHGQVPPQRRPEPSRSRLCRRQPGQGHLPVPAVTIHCQCHQHRTVVESDEVVLERALTAAAISARRPIGLVCGVQIQRWHYAAQSSAGLNRRSCGDRPPLALAGEAFAGPKVEAFLWAGRRRGGAGIDVIRHQARRHDSGTVPPGVDLHPDLVGVFAESGRALPSVMTSPSMRPGSGRPDSRRPGRSLHALLDRPVERFAERLIGPHGTSSSRTRSNALRVRRERRFEDLVILQVLAANRVGGQSAGRR